LYLFLADQDPGFEEFAEADQDPGLLFYKKMCLFTSKKQKNFFVSGSGTLPSVKMFYIFKDVSMMNSEESAKRREDFLSLQEGRTSNFAVVDYAYDTDKARWCEITLRYGMLHFQIGFCSKEYFMKKVGSLIYS